MKMNHLARIAAVFGLACVSAGAVSASFPDHPITLVVPFAAGGGVDSVARIIGKAMSKELGQPIVVENRAGAAGQLGTDYVARRAPADGYTLLIASPGAITAGPALFPDLRYSPERDLATVGQAVTIPNIVAANPSFPAKNIKELVELAKRGTHRITYGSGGTGTSQHLAGELLAYTLGIPMQHVPYKGTAPSIMDALSGQIDMTIADPSVAQYIHGGQLRIIGITTKKRSQALPDFPTLAEQGVKDYDAGNWYGFLVPKKTPHAVIDRLNQAVNHALNQPDVKASLLNMGMDPTPTTPDEFQAFLNEDLARWTKLVNAVGLHPN